MLSQAVDFRSAFGININSLGVHWRCLEWSSKHFILNLQVGGWPNVNFENALSMSRGKDLAGFVIKGS